MKLKLFTLILCAIICANTYIGAKDISKSAQSSICKITVFQADGKQLSGYGFFYEEGGKVVSSYDLFKHAKQAVITNNKGKEYAITRITGASDTYNLVTALTTWEKAPYIPISSGSTTGKIIYFAKDKEPQDAIIKDKSSLYSYNYYTYNLPNDSTSIGLPVINDEGQVIAITQANFTKENLLCGIDARVIKTIGINSLSFANNAFTSIYIPKAIPTNEQDALSYLFLATKQKKIDSTAVETIVADFIQQYPSYTADALMERANFYASHGNYQRADDDYNEALKKCPKDKKDQVHYAYSKIMYTYTHYPIDQATEQALTAYELNPLPLYLQQIADCYFAEKKYNDAAETYKKLCNTTLASSYSYFQTARCLLELQEKDTIQIIQLLDSAIAKAPVPHQEQCINYYFYRAQLFFGKGEYRKAVFDYNEIENIKKQQGLTPFFYQMRAKAELEAHMYQQALDDADRLISLDENNDEYYFIKIEILLRAGEIEKAQGIASQCIKRNDKNATAYRIMGIIQAQLGNKAEAENNFKKAAECGDQSALELIPTLSK